MARKTHKRKGARKQRTSRRGGVWPFDGISAALFGGPKDPNAPPGPQPPGMFFGENKPPADSAPPAGMTVRDPVGPSPTNPGINGGKTRRRRGGKKSRRR